MLNLDQIAQLITFAMNENKGTSSKHSYPGLSNTNEVGNFMNYLIRQLKAEVDEKA